MKKYYCKSCYNKSLLKVINVGKSPPCDEYLKKKDLKKKIINYSLDLFFCNYCKLIQLNDIVASKKIYINYLYKTKHSVGLSEHFYEYAKNVYKLLNIKKKNKIIDIGCNDGTFLSFFKKKGFKVVGIDPANNIVSDCKKQNIELINDFFNYRLAKKLKKKHSCELITANNVLANIPNINSFFKGISFLLNDNGYFIFETIYGPDIIKNKYIDMINSEHLYYFSLKSLSYMLKKNNLKIIKIKKSKIKGGSIRIYSKKIDSVKLYSENIVVKNLLQKEKILGFHNFNKLKKINIKYEIYKRNVISFLKNLKKNKYKIFGYGAAAGATTILHFFKMNNYIDSIIDDNPIRENLYSPGYRIKICSPKKIYSDKPDYIFIFAWRYADRILKKNNKFKKNGGKFIIPLPNLKII